MATPASAPTPSTAAVFDASLRVDALIRVSPSAITTPLIADAHITGPAVTVTHRGSVDVFLAAIDAAQPGDVLVIDNGGRLDQACIGDLVVLEARQAGLAGIVLWGLHRDTAQLHELGLPIWSMGASPAGPTKAEGKPELADTIPFGTFEVTRGDIVVADTDGVMFVTADDWPSVSSTAREIMQTEVRQANLMAAGTSLREQVDFGTYFDAVRTGEDITFREHLRARKAEIEE
ncbi:MAG: RraA family protein [Microbacteriaceae bacterium]|nr:RraA family protein [Microbacteriaceae bacterium]